MDKNIKHIVEKYLSNSCSQKELDFLRKHLKLNDLSKLEEVIKEDWDATNFNTISDAKEEEIWLKLKTVIDNKEPASTIQKKNKFSILKYAAIFIGIITSSVLIYNYNNTNHFEQKVNQITIELHDGTTKIIKPTTKQSIIKNVYGTTIAKQHENTLSYSQNNDNETHKKLIFNTLNVPYGEKFQLILSDGSEIYLNSGSSLKYPVNFIKGSTREVYLNGEGYFNIAKDETDSFIVNTPHVSTKVYGTEFNVSSYNNEEFVKVVLVEGSVAVSEKNEANFTHKLKPNEIASYNISKESIAINSVDINSYIAWIDDVLLFKNENFTNIIRKLERHYNVSIINNSNVSNEKFTGRFEVESIEDVLNTFKRTTAFTYEINKKEIIIKP